MADDPAAAGPATEAGHPMNATINEMTSHSITDDMFGEILEGAIVWEDQEDMIPVADEATSLDPEPATSAHDHAETEVDHAAD